MAGVDGDWACVARTPMGEQRFTLTVASTGDRFTGSVSGAIGSKAIEDGRFAGDRLEWTMTTSVPITLTLDCSVTVSGDALAGSVQAGGFGSFPLDGTRA